GVIAIDWPTYSRRRWTGQAPPLLEPLMPSKVVGSRPQLETTSNLRRQLEQTPAKLRPHLLTRHLQAEVGRVLCWKDGRPPEPHRGFFDPGMAPLRAGEAPNRLQQLALPGPVPSTLLFDHPTIDKLAHYLAGQIEPTVPLEQGGPRGTAR